MDWKEKYEKSFISADEAANLVKSGDRVVWPQGREGLACAMALCARKEDLKDVKILPTPSYDVGWYDEGWHDSFDVTVMQPNAVDQDAIDNRRCDVCIPWLIPDPMRTDTVPPDVVFVEISTPDDKGFCSFGSSLWDKRRRVQQAKLTVGEVNPNLIRTYGENYVHVSEIDYFVEHLSSGGAPGMVGSLAGRGVKEPEPYIKRIAEYVGELVNDGDTLQIGVGRVTEHLTALGAFKGKQDLGWHSEATPPGIIGLVRDGVINGSRKTLNKGKAVVTSIGGSSREDMAWVNMNPLFYLVDVDYLEDIRVIGAHDNFVGINQALAIDLTGQIGAETLGHRLFGGAGGQISFVFGSALSKGGRAITVIPSTARNGTVSRIMPTLPPGTVVTIQRNCADFIVSEYGVARLRGQTIKERVRQLINIAHPDFRADLRKAADKFC